jgi:hypothetical protein
MEILIFAVLLGLIAHQQTLNSGLESFLGVAFSERLRVLVRDVSVPL